MSLMGNRGYIFIFKSGEALPLTDVISEFSRDPLGQGDHSAHHAELLRQVSLKSDLLQKDIKSIGGQLIFYSIDK
jgi:hypothetical protein